MDVKDVVFGYGIDAVIMECFEYESENLAEAIKTKDSIAYKFHSMRLETLARAKEGLFESQNAVPFII